MTFDRARFLARRRVRDGLLRLAVAASGPSDRVWRAKNRIADGLVMASALGGPAGLFDIPDYPTTILARAGGHVERLELFAAAPGSGYRRSDFSQVDGVAPAPMFGRGGIHMFMTTDRVGGMRYFVRAWIDGTAHDSDVALSKIESAPTVRRAGALQLQRDSGSATFSWPRFREPGLWTSFLLVLQGPERLMTTGVYSWDERWRFPDVRHVPFFYHPTAPPPSLTPGSDYEAVYVAIDRDRWIPYLDWLRFTA